MTHPYDQLTLGTSDVKKIYLEFKPFEKSLGEEEYEIATTTWAMMADFERAGRNTFVVSKNLSDMFDRIDCRTVSLEDLKAPFQSFFMKFGESYVGFAQDEETRVICVFKDAWVKATLRVPNAGKLGDAIDKTRLIENADDELEEHLRLFTLSVQFMAFLNQCPESAVLDKDHEKRRRLRKSISRLRGRKRKRATESLVKIGSTTIYHVGAEFKESDTDIRLHWVRGHWRRQPYGPRDNPEYKLVWIKPFQRGTEEEGVVERRTYT